MKRYEKLAWIIDARRNCEESGNEEWRIKHGETITDLLSTAPSGSGFDSGTTLSTLKSDRSKLVFDTSYHHMNEHGYYCGWTDHQVIVVPSFVGGYDLRVTGRNVNDIKDYIGDVFSSWLSEEITE
jgi:hypothetical protein